MKEFVLKGEELQYLMASVLNAGPESRVKVRGRGYSMAPFIKDHSAIMLRPVDQKRRARLGDIVAVPSPKKTKIIVHRIIRLNNGYCQTKGDNCLKADEWFSIDSIIGIVDEIEKTGWIPYHCKPWQNVIIAVASKTGVLNRLLYPGFVYMRNLMGYNRVIKK